MDSSAPTLITRTLAQAKPALLQMGLVFSPVVNILVLTSSLYMMQVFDRVLTSQSQSTLLYLTLIALGAIALMAALELVRSRIMVRLASWLEARLAPEGLQRALEATLTGQPYRGEALRDLAHLRSFLANPTTLSLFDMPWIPVFIIVVYVLHPVLGHVALLGAVSLAALAWWNDRITHKHLREAAVRATSNSRRTDAALRNAQTIDVMGMLPGLLQRWQREQSLTQAQQDLAQDRAGALMALSKFLRLALQILVLAVGAELVINRDLTAGGMIAASILIARALAPIEGIIGNWRGVVSAHEASKRLQASFARAWLRPHAMQLPKPTGALSVEQVVYGPLAGQPPVIRGVSFTAQPGQLVVIVGPSAAGKSTLARLCVGACPPAHGHVRLDGADVFSWDRRDFAPHVGYLPQEVELFDGTVRENIARLQECDPAAVVDAAQQAGAHELILRLPQGYETEIGEGGQKLSGGQRQRIALARALFGNPQFIVLDEPNSSLDADGEEALNRALLSLKQRGATVVLVGHRPSVLQHADTIILLRDGRIELSGPRHEVLPRILPAAAAAPTARVAAAPAGA